MVHLMTLVLFAKDVEIGSGYLTAIAIFISTLLVAMGAFLGRLIPIWTKARVDEGESDTKRKIAEADALAKAKATEADALAKAAAVHESMRREAHTQVYAEFHSMLDRSGLEIKRLNEAMARQDGVISAQDKRIQDLFTEIRAGTMAHADCLVKNEQLMGRLMVMDARMESLRLAEERAGLETSLEAIIVTDARGIVETWSPPAVALFHYAPREMVGKSIEQVVPPEEIKKHLPMFRTLIDTGKPVRRGPYRVTARTREGSALVADVKLASWLDDKDERHFVAAVRPVIDNPAAQVPLATLAAMSESARQAVVTLTNAPVPTPGKMPEEKPHPNPEKER